MNQPRITKKKDWKITATMTGGQRVHYFFDTESDANIAASMLMAHSRDVTDAVVTPRA